MFHSFLSIALRSFLILPSYMIDISILYLSLLKKLLIWNDLWLSHFLLVHLMEVISSDLRIVLTGAILCGSKISIVSLESHLACLIHCDIGAVGTYFLAEFAYHFLDFDVQIIDIGSFDLFNMFQLFSITKLQLAFFADLFSLHFTVSLILSFDRRMLAVIWVWCFVMIMMAIFVLPSRLGLFVGLERLAVVVVMVEIRSLHFHFFNSKLY